MQKATYAGGLNEFSYCASLHISHPSFAPADITAPLAMEPNRTSQAGHPHRSVPNRVYDFSHWSFELPTQNGEDISTFLRQFVDLMTPNRSFFQQLSNDGAEIECFIGVFATRLCDQMYSHNLLGSLSDLHVNLRFDLHASDDRKTYDAFGAPLSFAQATHCWWYLSSLKLNDIAMAMLQIPSMCQLSACILYVNPLIDYNTTAIVDSRWRILSPHGVSTS